MKSTQMTYLSDMQVTSLMAYDSIKNSLGEKQRIVLEAIFKLKEASNYDIKKHLGWEINSITPRVKELRDRGLVKESKKDTDPISGRKVIYWKIAN